MRVIRELQVQERIMDYLTGRRPTTKAIRQAISEYLARARAARKK
jgi:hypothetical protein